MKTPNEVVSIEKEEEHKETVTISKGKGKGNGSKEDAKPNSSSTKKRRSRGRLSLSHHTKHYVEHNYHDHINDPIKVGVPSVAEPEEEQCSKKRRGHRGGVATPFPEKLHYMLSQMDREGTADIVTWQPHGRCFIVRKSNEFVEEIMPRYFRQSKLTSFQRQLNLYGFSRLTAGPDRGAYYHELFIRGRMDLCKSMTRTRVKGNGSKAASSPGTEPNFYKMEPCYETHSNDDEEEGNDECLEDHAGRIFEFPTTSTPELEGDSSEEMSDDGIMIYPEKDEVSILGPPIEALSPLPPFFPVATPAYRIGRSGSISSSDTSSMDQVKSSSLPIVSPCESRAVVSPPATPKLLSSLSIPPMPSIEESIPHPTLNLESQSVPVAGDFHSGDQIFFEGLPFHYLETKDVEGSLNPVGWAA